MISPSSLCRGRVTHVGLGALLTALCAPSPASAQAEAEKPAPNVLLLVDTSGSMEFKADGTFPACDPGNTPVEEKSRWIDLVEVMTGTFDGYSCWAQDRSSTAFRDEFLLEGVTPYDFGYVNPYHRPLSNLCAYGPGVLPSSTSPYAWPDRAVNTFPFADGALTRPATGLLPSHPGCPAFKQLGDGLLDVYKDMVRFGLMTFDARVNSGTGLSGSSADHETGVDGNWSYYLGEPITGHPANCAFDMIQEIGARNAAAPPWEGRMIGFGPPNLASHDERNNWMQEVLLSARPYGATPIAGQLDDARQFLWNDTSIDPLDSAGTAEFGPTNDPNWRAANCRETILILLTDGEPNLDLRPFCEAEPPPPETAGRCPYEQPEEIVSSLRLSPPVPSLAVETYVIGFALAKVTPFGGTEISCADLTDAHCADPLNNDADAYPESKNIQACCTLNKIAAAGGFESPGVPRKAYFAQDRTELKAMFTSILAKVATFATRTMPVFSSPGGDTTSKGFKFSSAFNPQPDPDGPLLWEGLLKRTRLICNDELVPEPALVRAVDGDDFAANLNSGSPQRQFHTFIGDGDNLNSIRPSVLADDDGLGLSTGTQVFASQPDELDDVIPAAALDVDASACDGAADANECRDRIVRHLVGVADGSNPSRCTPTECHLFGAIVHSTPTIVPGRPSELLRDESYTSFVNAMDAIDRPTTLYTSTTDGMLHAFNVAPFPGSPNAEAEQIDELQNNELWAFLPPAVLPVLQTQYPNTPQVLLDGIPIIKDVVANDTEDRFERLQSEAQAGTGNWRTAFVQGFGPSVVKGGYFALDITKPTRGAEPPKFLWQLTRDNSGGELFGVGGTPVITTVFLDQPTGGPREVAVAVLPGGNAAPSSGAAATIGPITEVDPDEFTTERVGRSYPGAEAARSLTIVRLDTGEVIRTFRPAAEAARFSSTVFTSTDITAPITGQPKAFPEQTGAVADRIFVGDRDGRLWRVDVSSKNPALWTMKIFYDAFEEGTFEDSQPVILPPVLSVNELGEVTVAFATGAQDLTSGDPSVNRVISLTETSSETDIVAHLNWRQTLDAGDRVTGPMVLFNSGLYYSVSRPPTTSTAVCDVGSSKVYGAHYEDNDDVANNRPDPKATSGPAPVKKGDTLVIANESGIIFGLSLEAEASCASEEEIIDGNESFGYGEVRMSKQVNPGRFFLSYGASGAEGGSEAPGVLEVRRQLETPQLAVTFESWATVYE